MLKVFAVIIVLIIGLIITAPALIIKFTVWDASDPSDDKTGLSKLFYGLTPHIPAANVNQTLDIEMGAVIVDVRSKKEYDQGYIKNALNIPEETLYESFPKKYPDKNTLVYLYCDTGHRGATATRLLKSMGYDRAFNIETGIKGWEKAGFRLVRPNPQYF